MRWIVCLIGIAGPVAAQEWEVLTQDSAIYEVLAGATVEFDPLTYQRFNTDGTTDYVTERFASGLWRVQDGQYCHQWPPASRLECFDVHLDGNRVKFVAPNQTQSTGTLR